MFTVEFKMVKCDVKSLYTIIPNHDGLTALKFWLERQDVVPYPVVTILRLAELVLVDSGVRAGNEPTTLE